MLNSVCICGRLTKDSSLAYTPSGVAVCTFTLAVDRNFKNSAGEREADFIPVVVYRQLAELCANYLSKGNMAAVDGRIQTRNYDKDGHKIYVTEVIAENVQFLSPKKSTEVSDNGGENPYGHEVSLDDDIPF